MVIDLAEVYKRVTTREPESIRVLGGASLVQLVNTAGTLLELGRQHHGTWLPGFARNMYGLAVGFPQRRELITQSSLPHYADRVNHTIYTPGEFGPDEFTRELDPHQLDIKLRGFLEQSRPVTGDQVAAYIERVNDAGMCASLALGRMLYTMPDAGEPIRL